MNYTIYRESWRRGGDSQELTRELGDTSLYEARTKMMCCLGQFSFECGVPLESLEDIGEPSDISDNEGVLISGGLLLDDEDWGIQSGFSTRALLINDDDSISDQVREVSLIELAAKHGHSITFVDGVAPWFKAEDETLLFHQVSLKNNSLLAVGGRPEESGAPVTEQQKFSTKLRALADWYDQHPTVAVPQSDKLIFSICNFRATAEEIRAIGAGRKVYDDMFFKYIVENDAFMLQFLEYRNKVCVRKVVGMKLIPEEVVEAREATVIPAHEVEIVEWECPGSLLSEESSLEAPHD